ncbi:MAG: FAD-binding domain-containing protein, partial [Asticcacaulis sp.]|nr:FAD-binding domain-containing protein [Asticcacaulis sp.]
REFDAFPWQGDDDGFRAWCRGETGYDLVDAGMRELWQSGYMHNRVRMVCASFLTKHLLIDWRRGEQWFCDCLLDADPANNAASWQWVAGCGADAAPYFRIFNPITQADKFDPAGLYRARWLDGHKRPIPIIDHGHARNRALEAYRTLRNKDAGHDDSD